MSYLEQTNTRKPLGVMKSIFLLNHPSSLLKWEMDGVPRIFQIVSQPHGCCGAPFASTYQEAAESGFLQAWAHGRLNMRSVPLQQGS